MLKRYKFVARNEDGEHATTISIFFDAEATFLNAEIVRTSLVFQDTSDV